MPKWDEMHAKRMCRRKVRRLAWCNFSNESMSLMRGSTFLPPLQCLRSIESKWKQFLYSPTQARVRLKGSEFLWRRRLFISRNTCPVKLKFGYNFCLGICLNAFNCSIYLNSKSNPSPALFGSVLLLFYAYFRIYIAPAVVESPKVYSFLCDFDRFVRILRFSLFATPSPFLFIFVVVVVALFDLFFIETIPECRISRQGSSEHSGKWVSD